MIMAKPPYSITLTWHFRNGSRTRWFITRNWPPSAPYKNSSFVSINITGNAEVKLHANLVTLPSPRISPKSQNNLLPPWPQTTTGVLSPRPLVCQPAAPQIPLQHQSKAQPRWPIQLRQKRMTWLTSLVAMASLLLWSRMPMPQRHRTELSGTVWVGPDCLGPSEGLSFCPTDLPHSIHGMCHGLAYIILFISSFWS